MDLARIERLKEEDELVYYDLKEKFEDDLKKKELIHNRQ